MLRIICTFATEKTLTSGNDFKQRQNIALFPVQKVVLNALALNGAENVAGDVGSDDAGLTARTLQMQLSSPFKTSGLDRDVYDETPVNPSWPGADPNWNFQS